MKLEKITIPEHISEFYMKQKLKNGLAVVVRAVRPDDKKLIQEAFRNLEPETIYTRYFYHKTFLSEADLQWATELDFINDVAIVVTIMENGQEIVIGGSRYSLLINREEESKHAEIAFTVEEDYQGLGMAKLLLQTMAVIARSQDVSAFEAEVLSQNAPMSAVFERSGLKTTRRLEDGSYHFVMELDVVED